MLVLAHVTEVRPGFITASMFSLFGFMRATISFGKFSTRILYRSIRLRALLFLIKIKILINLILKEAILNIAFLFT